MRRCLFMIIRIIDVFEFAQAGGKPENNLNIKIM